MNLPMGFGNENSLGPFAKNHGDLNASSQGGSFGGAQAVSPKYEISIMLSLVPTTGTDLLAFCFR